MKKQHVTLTSADFEYLQKLLTKGTLKVRKQNRARGLLELHKGKTFTEVSELLNTSYPTVWGWSKKYKTEGLTFLDDKPRSGRPIGLSGEDRAKITAIACSEPPAGYARWSLRLLADKLVELEITDSISFKQVGIILKKMNCSLIEKDNGVSEK
jgi:transposase